MLSRRSNFGIAFGVVPECGLSQNGCAPSFCDGGGRQFGPSSLDSCLRLDSTKSDQNEGFFMPVEQKKGQDFSWHSVGAVARLFEHSDNLSLIQKGALLT